MADNKRKSALLVVVGLVVAVLLWIFGRSGAEVGDPDGATADASAERGLVGRELHGATAGGDEGAPLGPRSRLAGHVLDLEDVPIADAQVCVALPELSTALGWLPRCVNADGDGHFLIEPLAPGQHRLIASARGFILPPIPSMRGPVGVTTRVGPGEARDDLVLRLRPGGAEVRGVVRDITGGTVEEALVWTDSAATHSDDEGRFSLWLDTRSFVEIEVRAEGYARAGLVEFRPAGRVLEVLLRPEIILSGRVIAAESGAPVADVPVVASEPGMLSYSGSFSTEPQVRTGEDGRFTFSGLGPGRYKPQVHAGSWRGQASESVLLVIGESPAEVEIKVYPARRVEGRLLRRVSRTPCSEGGLVVYDAAGAIVDRAQADADGAIALGGLLPGPYDLELRCAQGEAPLAPLAVDLHGDDLLGALWEAEELSGRSIRGRVVDADGRGVAMAYVGGELRDPADPDDPGAHAAALAGTHAVTDVDGAFEIHHLPAGGYEFYRVQAEGMADPVDTPKVTLPSDRDVDDLLITLPRAGALQVRVQDSSGAPVTSASIKVSRVGGGGSNLRGMPDGVWKLDPTTPGIYQVKLHRPGVGGRAGPDDPSNDDPGEEVEVVPGRTSTLTLVTARRDRSIRGIVRSRDGDRIADASVWATGASTFIDWGGRARHPEIARTVSDIDGEFVLEGLEEGTYTVHARDGVGVEESIAGVESGSASVAFALAEGGSIAGRVQVRGGEPPASFSISVQPADGGRGRKEEFLRTGGAWRIADLPPGEVAIEVQCAEGTAGQRATIPEGGEVNGITLELAARGALRGRLLDADTGAPVSGYMATVQSADGRAGAASLDPAGQRYSAEDGSFELQQVPSGDVILHLWPGKARLQGYANHEERILIRPGGMTDAGAIKVKRRGTADAPKTGEDGKGEEPSDAPKTGEDGKGEEPSDAPKTGER